MKWLFHAFAICALLLSTAQAHVSREHPGQRVGGSERFRERETS